MKITDVHCHIYPKKISDKASKGIGVFYDTEMKYEGCTDRLVEVGRKNGIEKFWVFSAATIPAQVHSINTFIAEECRAHPEFVGFGSLHPDLENIEEEVEYMISLGLHGVKFHPDFQKFLLDDEKAMPMYAALEGRLPIIVHTGDYRHPYSEPQRMRKVLDRFPGLGCVCAHFGGWSVWDMGYDCLHDTQCVVDTSSTFGFLNDDEHVMRLIEKWGTDRLLFGSDFPMWNSADELERLKGLITDPEKLEDVLWRNADRFLKREVRG